MRVIIPFDRLRGAALGATLGNGMAALKIEEVRGLPMNTNAVTS
ncbi:hypothetical protein CLV42_115125 [Chitinophaga ginsengisoli]|uniref:Uncharacterized protein n=1 Tax=Chitinophaga ginsengisoli TaxID=363837 RepID=A0A2P8FS30_9BACT|nr:hypothetical protein CLV42_115125 [Chitinophaga ginsengisoli]